MVVKVNSSLEVNTCTKYQTTWNSIHILQFMSSHLYHTKYQKFLLILLHYFQIKQFMILLSQSMKKRVFEEKAQPKDKGIFVDTIEIREFFGLMVNVGHLKIEKTQVLMCHEIQLWSFHMSCHNESYQVEKSTSFFML